MTMPLISCLMVTKRLNNNWTFQSVNSFVSQDYPDKELVVVYSHSTDDQVYKFLDYCHSKSVKPIMYRVKELVKLGEARNISIDLANGEYVCQWDDDDLSHRNRLSFQYENMANAEVSLLAAQYHEINGKMYVEQRKPHQQAVHAAWCGTVMGKKKALLDVYPKWESIAEDTHGLEKLNNIKVIQYNSPFFHFLYRFNGQNTWNIEHNEMMVRENTYCEYDEVIGEWVVDGFSV